MMRKKFFLHSLFILLALVFSLSLIVNFNSMLSTNSLYAIHGTQENYSWSVAKFVIKLAEFDTLIAKRIHHTLTERDDDDIRLKLDILFSRIKVIRDRSSSTKFLYLQPEYPELIDNIYDRLVDIDHELSKPTPDFALISSLSEGMKPYANLLGNVADHAEVEQRTLAFDDFLEKRKTLRALLLFASVFILALCFISYFYIRSLTKSLELEKKAFNNKNAFLGIVGHELRTSLQAVISSIDVITQSRNEKQNSTAMSRLESAATQIVCQMQDLTEFAKVDNGIVEINHSVFNIARLIESTVSECLLPYPGKAISVNIEELPQESIESDPNRIKQIVENLLTNAIKYTDKGQITIKVSIFRSAILTITISDTGTGIPKDKLKYIFQPFIRIEPNTQSIPGFGMGLAIINGVTKAMKGSISVKSEVGKGSTFTVNLPIIVSPPLHREISPANNETYTAFKGINILIVDDNELSCASISMMLQSAGYRCETTTLPERALQKLMRKPGYDLVLSDLQMPKITGDKLQHALRLQHGPNRNIPFIFISAYTSVSPDKATPVLTKPVRISDIEKAIHQVMQKQDKI